MQRRKRHAAEEGLARQPDHHVGILAERPQQRELLQPREGFAENVDALGFERVEVIHRWALEAPIGRNLRDRRCLGRAGPTHPVFCVIVVEKMHLRPLALRGENSIVAVQ